MNTVLKFRNDDDVKAKVFILDGIENIDKLALRAEEAEYVRRSYGEDKDKTVVIDRYTELYVIFFIAADADVKDFMEDCRRKGAVICKLLNRSKYEDVLIQDIGVERCAKVGVAEGIMLANYEFKKYKTDAKANALKTVWLLEGTACADCVDMMNVTVEATLFARDLVNEPANHLNAEDLADIISAKVREAGGQAEVLNKKKIEALKMGGLLAVNAGSVDEPTFTILEWKPEKPVNDRPIVLVGKGIVFDTGGYNLKTAQFMNDMKHDMSGAATVAAAVYAAAKAKMPVHVIALVPATDNRLDGNAHVTGDVITMFDGTTVEVLNTDAEGRLILADALAYAKKYNPLMVFDFATLTGAASYAIGPYATVCVGKDSDDIYRKLEDLGERVYERLVRFPMFKEYGEMIKSDIADIKNVGGKFGGAITAGKFLEHFTDYPWVHFDIAGTAYLDKAEYYKPAGATGIHVRLLMKFFREFFS